MVHNLYAKTKMERNDFYFSPRVCKGVSGKVNISFDTASVCW